MSGQGSSLQQHGGIARRAHRQLTESLCCVDRQLSCDDSTRHDVSMTATAIAATCRGSSSTGEHWMWRTWMDCCTMDGRPRGKVLVHSTNGAAAVNR